MSKSSKRFRYARYSLPFHGSFVVPFWEIGSDIVHKVPDDLMKSIMQGRGISGDEDAISLCQGAEPIYDLHTRNEGIAYPSEHSLMYRAGSSDPDALIEVGGLSPDYECECLRLGAGGALSAYDEWDGG